MKSLSGKPQMLRKVNSSMIEQLVYENGPISKPELVKRSGLSLPTVSKLVDDLEKKASIRSKGLSGNGVGRKAILYEINRNSGCFLTCNFNEGNLECCLVDMLNNIFYKKSFPLHSGSSLKALNSMFHAIDTLIEQAPAQVKIIGIGLPGVVHPNGSLMAIPQIAVWEGFNVKKALMTRYKTAIYVENNVKLSAMGYFYTHLIKKQNNLVYLYVGNGIGSGIILNSQLYRGSGDFSGEIGFMTDSCSPLKKSYVSSGGYMESLMSPLVDYTTGTLRQKGSPKLRHKLITILSTIAVNHVVLLNPDVIVFAGKIFDKKLIEAINKRMRFFLPEEIMPIISHDLSKTTELEGLIQSCRGFITTGMQLVQSTGLDHRADRIAV